MICEGKHNTATVNAPAITRQNRSMMAMALRREGRSFAPQYCAVSTAAPPPMPMHRIWNMVINSLARDEPDSWVSPYWPSISVSTMFTPMVIRFCRITGMAIRSTAE